MNNFYVLVLSTIFAISAVSGQVIAKSKIIKIDSLEYIHQSSLTKDTMVIFDIGNVLVEKTNVAENRAMDGDLALPDILKICFQPGINSKNSCFDNACKRRFKLVDDKIPTIIKKLKEQEIKVIALTSSFSGTVSSINNYDDWLIRLLNIFDINFNSSFSQPNVISFSVHVLDGYRPTYNSGIVFASKINKGTVFKAFLAFKEFKPDKVIFIDDSKSNLEAVKQVADELNIPFLGLHYTVIEDRLARIKS